MLRDTLAAKAEHTRNYQLTIFIDRGTRTAKSDGFHRAYLENTSTRRAQQTCVRSLT
jgi:hypothetical protein